MEGANIRTLTVKWLPVLLRAVIVYVVIGPATQKFFDYETMVGFFTALGIPAPEVMVVFVGVIEMSAVILLALVLAIEMVVAMLTAGRNTNNTVVLLSCLGIVALGTGAFSLWQPEARWIARLRGRPAAQTNRGRTL